MAAQNPVVQRFAAIDIGTCTCRLLVADVGDGGLEEVHRRCEIVNLGEGVDASGVLAPEAMQRTRDMIASYREDIERLASPGNPVDVTAIATSACRDARNSDVFIAMLEEIGVHLSIIPGQREAELSFLGASAAYQGENLLVADVGGGSTELVFGCGGQKSALSHSFDIGCRRVTERLLRSDPPTKEEMAQAGSWCRSRFAPLFDRRAEEQGEIERMVAVAGTATSVVSVHEAMDPYDSQRVNGYRVTREILEEVRARLARMPLERRKKVKGLQPQRAGVIVGGLIILQNVLDLAGVDSFSVSESDILQGTVVDAYRSSSAPGSVRSKKAPQPSAPVVS